MSQSLNLLGSQPVQVYLAGEMLVLYPLPLEALGSANARLPSTVL